MREEEGERLARYIAQSGFASRREADRLVQEGQVTVNGKTVTQPGHRIDPASDQVRVQGKVVTGPPPRVYYLYHKPRGLLTTRVDPEGRPSIHAVLPRLPFRVEAVGRLDYDSEGALLLTNDGDLANRLTHPSYQVPRRYVVKVYRTPASHTLERLRQGVRLEDGPTGPCRVRILDTTEKDNAWLEITVTEGRNRLVRRMMEAVGHPVSKLRRESYGPIELDDLPRGALRLLEPHEVNALKKAVAQVPERDPKLRRPRPRKPWNGGDREQDGVQRARQRSSGERKRKA